VIRDPQCQRCKLSEGVDKVCEMGFGAKKADIMVVSLRPNSSVYQEMIENALSDAGIELRRCYYTSAIKCRNWDLDIRKPELKACYYYLEQEIQKVQPKWILAFGNEALNILTGASGIMKYRGRVIDKGAYKVIATVSPAAVRRNPGQQGGWQADILFFASQVAGITESIQAPPFHVVWDKVKLKKLKLALESAKLVSFDIETVGLDEWGPDSAIVSIAFTLVHETKTIVGDLVSIWLVPLYHPESPFKLKWRQVLKYLAKALEGVPKRIAHNGKFDSKWLREFGIESCDVTFDTIYAASLLDENRVKGLKPLCRMLLGVAPWEIPTHDLLSQPIKRVLKYNGLDTFYCYHLYLVLKAELLEQPRLTRIFTQLMMPAANELIDVERRGIWCDPVKRQSAIQVAFGMRDQLDEKLMAMVPDPDSPGSSMWANSNLAWPTDARGRRRAVNFNASIFARWWLFEHLGLPVITRGKTKADGSPGDPSMAEDVMIELKTTNHPVIELLMERSKWQKYCSTYVERYEEVADHRDRVHTTFKLHGTVTGRLSSGKEDEEKISARRDRGSGVNIQQVPRDNFIRGLFGARPGWWFVEADFGQVEFRLAAYISRDRTALGFLQNGVDVHLEMATRMTGKPGSAITKEERKHAKPVNFGFLYGMGWKKFIHTAKTKYMIDFSEDAARNARSTFFDMYPGFLQWHARQRRLVHQFGRVESPLGRVRHLPDIYSQDNNVVAEAERQAINSPVQSLASDMNLLAMILLAKEFRKRGLRAYCLGLIHDAINFEIHEKDLPQALPLIKYTMENLPLKRMFGLNLDVPIISDLKIGSHWGGAQELSAMEVAEFKKVRDKFLVRGG
jgi:uracil-DNA glycosylase family 4